MMAENVEKVIDMRKNGGSVNYIAFKAKVPLASVRKILKHAGLDQKGLQKWRASRIEKMNSEGHSIGQIALKLKVTKDSVRNIAKKYGVELTPRRKKSEVETKPMAMRRTPRKPEPETETCSLCGGRLSVEYYTQVCPETGKKTPMVLKRCQGKGGGRKCGEVVKEEVT